MLSWTNLGSSNTTSGKTLTFTPSKYKEYLLIASNNGSRVLASSQIPYSLIAIGSTASAGYHQARNYDNKYAAGVSFTTTGTVLYVTNTSSYGILLGR